MMMWIAVFFDMCMYANASEVDFTAKVHQEIEQQISTRLEIPPEDVTVHHLGMANAHRCSKATYIKVEIPEREDFRGKTLIGIEGWNGASLCGRWTVQGDVEIWGKIPTSEFAAQAGEEVSVIWKRARLDSIREPMFVQTPELKDATLLAIVPIGQGAVLKRNHVRRKPDFKQGDSVVVVVQKGTLIVKVQGMLLKSAYVGDTVKVRSASTNSILEGQLTENGMVLLK